ncbi:MAG: Bax inhibitor-1/YccA family protein [Bacteroidia bacterium]|nr:Bax inhibitor-1/YccA family protein [Bacteroidia bacterium]MBN8691555.1 Bax inhibitor-1/YccA family protein [Bacteroidota bacterium]
MENTNFRSTNINNIQDATIVNSSTLLRSVFSWMTLALVITTISSMLFAFVPDLVRMLFVETAEGYKLSIFAWVVMFAPLGFVMLMSFGFNKLSYPALIAVFLAYSAVNGISLSFIFMVYELGSIFNVFLSSVALFAVMAIAGYTTKTDLTKMGSLLMIGLIGIIIASVINIFMQSDKMSFICSILGVIIFTGLTAWDVQKIKNLAAEDDGSTPFRKLAVMGALNLYLDFINIFLYLLRLFGGRKD